MRSLILTAVLAVGFGAVAVAPAQAAAGSARVTAVGSGVDQVAQGCGRDAYRDRHGHCHRNYRR